jgi:hypothetical protein
MSIQFLVAADNPGPAYAFDGAAFNLISAANGWPVDNGGVIGLFKSGATYVQFLYDATAVKIRAYTSPDLAVWTEQDAAHAPTYNQSATLGGPGNQDPNLAVVQSTKTAGVFYALYFSGVGGAVGNQFLTLQPFTVGTGWGAAQVSTLPLTNIGGGIQESAISGVAVYRPSDDSVFYITGIGTELTGGPTLIPYYAQCKPNSTGWANVWVEIGPIPNVPTGANPPAPGTNSISACLDTGGNVCVWTKTQVAAVAAQQFHVYFQRIHADNTLGGVQLVDGTNLLTSGYLAGCFCSTAGKLYVARMGNAVSAIYSGFTADAPVWTETALPTLQGNFPSWLDFSQVGGTVTAFTLEHDGQTVSQVADPFTAAAVAVAVAPVVVFVIFTLKAALSVNATLTLTFKGMKVYGQS